MSLQFSKKGEKCKASNYRPVSLTSICCKIQEHVITSNVLNHLDDYKILTDCQHGFRARRSCETQLLTLAQELLEGLDKKHQNDLIILDFSKAFDRVPHERLLRKLDHYGIRGSTHNWIKGFLTDRTQQVLVEGAASENIPVISGVPQGTVLGPLLFCYSSMTCQTVSNQAHNSLLMTVFSTEESGTNMTVLYCKMTSIS